MNALKNPSYPIYLHIDNNLINCLSGLATATKEMHWIHRDLTVSYSSHWGRLFWSIAQLFDCLRAHYYHINLNSSRQMLYELYPIVMQKDESIQTLFFKAVKNYNDIVSKGHRIDSQELKIVEQQEKIMDVVGPLKQKKIIFDCGDKQTSTLILKQSDITKEKAYVIVNAANEDLLKGGGVDHAIHTVGGSQIAQACKKIREAGQQPPCPTGQAVITPAGNLPAIYVVHAVGPKWHLKDSKKAAKLLENAYKNSLELAFTTWNEDRDPDKKPFKIAFPSISTGAFGYPVKEAAAIALNVVRKWLINHPNTEVNFLFWGPTKEEDYQAYTQ